MRNRLLILLIVCLGLVFVAGCTSPLSAQNEYRLDIETKPFKIKKTKCTQKTLKIDRAFGDKLYMSLKMYYVKGKYTQNTYAYSRWAQSPTDKISQAMTEYLRAMQLFKSVQNADSKTKNDLSMEVNIEDFMQYFDENEKNSYAKVTITCSLINESTHKIIATKTFHAKSKALSNDAKGGVIALNMALNSILSACGLWLQGVCFDQ